MDLKDLTELVVNNNDCVVLKVKENNEIDLIAFGVFNGDEKMFRLTKGRQVTCTVFLTNGKHFSWEWGASGYTLVSDSMRTKGRIIQNCIERSYGIKYLF
mgnify:CR=1 FL=1